MRLLCTLVLLTCALPLNADWRSTSDESELSFAASYENEEVAGQFRSFLVRAVFDPNNPADGTLDVKVVTQSVDMGGVELNQELATPTWFDPQRFPQASFYTDYILPANEGFVAQGYLQLKNSRRSIRVPFTWTREGATAVMEGELSLDRTDFGIGSGEWADDEVVGYNVSVHFRITLVPTT